jgi:twitching motility protein PilT
MIDHLNRHRPVHVVTIEDPVEFIRAPEMASVTSREVDVDTHSFADARRHVMRQNPDVILVGEMRDLETIQLAITAGETGHLVFSTLYTLSAAQTIDQDLFRLYQEGQISGEDALAKANGPEEFCRRAGIS